MGKGAISENDLMHRLVSAKKIINKVESGNFEKGAINEDVLFADPEQLVKLDLPTNNVKSVKQVQPSVDKINNSKLPPEIKKAMIENPIPQISLNESMDMDFIKGAKQLMEREGLKSKSTPKTNQVSSNIDYNQIAVLIENTVRKVLDEKLNQILTAQQTKNINENLVLKVGDSIFSGKITSVKSK